MKKLISKSREETVKYGEKLGALLKKGDMIAFKGGLGAGKTAFSSGIALGLGLLKAEISSPTFSLVNEYVGDHITMYHFDMYRIQTEEGLESTGFFDYPFEDGVAVIEWSENIMEFLPKNTIYITINTLSENEREIIIEEDGRFADTWN